MKTVIKLTKIAILIVLCSCIEDKGNYDYHPVNTVEIEGINDSYSIPLGESIIITPILNFSLGEGVDEFEYQWCVMQDYVPYDLKGILSTERNLDVIIGGTGCPITKEGSYYMLYSVQNKTTQVKYYKVFKLNVINRMQTGFTMLCETAKGFDIDLISLYNDTLTQYHNVLDLYQSELPHEGVKPLDLVCFGDYLSPAIGDYLDEENKTGTPKRYALWVLTDRGTDRVRVEDFVYKPKYNISSVIVRTSNSLFPDDDIIAIDKMFSVSGHSNSSGRAYSYYNGNWFMYNYSPMTYMYMLPVNQYVSTSTAPQYKSPPYIYVAGSYGALIFNLDENRFEYHKSFTTELNGSATDFFKTVQLSEGEYFNWQNKDYDLKYMGNRSSNAGFAVVYNRATGKYEFLQMSATTTTATQTGQSVFPSGFNADEIKFYAYHITLPYLYFATEDKVYRINTSTMSTIDDITAQVIPSGHKISLMRNTAVRFARTSQIIIATYNPSGAAGENAQLTCYNVEDGTGNLVLAKHPDTPTAAGYQIEMRWTGFGKVIAVDYKQPT